MSGKAEAKLKTRLLYAQGEDTLKLRLRFVADLLSISQHDTSDAMALALALRKKGVGRLLHNLFIDCLYIVARVRGSPISHASIKQATTETFDLGLRARLSWLPDNRDLVCFMYDCDLDHLTESLTQR